MPEEDLKRKLEEFKGRLEGTISRVDAMHRMLESKERRIAELEEENKNLREEIDSLEDEITHLEKTENEGLDFSKMRKQTAFSEDLSEIELSEEFKKEFREHEERNKKFLEEDNTTF